jgi:hypothetical protein
MGDLIGVSAGANAYISSYITYGFTIFVSGLTTTSGNVFS